MDCIYNGSELLTNVSVSKDNQTAASTYNYDTAKRLSNITSPSGTIYNFTYDTFSRNNNIKIGKNRTLSNYIYNKKGLLDQLIYAYGITVKYEYDILDRLVIERILDTTTKTELAKLRIRYDDSKNRVSRYDVNICYRV